MQAEVIGGYLRDCDFEVVVAGDGPEGIKMVVTRKPCAVILDVMLPTMSGLQVAKRLKRHRATSYIPLIMLTKLENDQNLIDGLDSGADYYITKDTNFAVELWRTPVALGIISWQ